MFGTQDPRAFLANRVQFNSIIGINGTLLIGPSQNDEITIGVPIQLGHIKA
jgi:hypothetical protein